MNIIKTSFLYFLSLMAARSLRLMTPISFEDVDCNLNYTTRVDKGLVMYIITVNQWKMMSKTRMWLFNSTTRYYQTEVLVLCKGEVILTKKDFFPEPSLSILNRTKLPHAIIALAALDKVCKLMEVAEVRA